MARYRVYAVEATGRMYDFVYTSDAVDDADAQQQAAHIWSGLALGVEVWSGNRLVTLMRFGSDLLAEPPSESLNQMQPIVSLTRGLDVLTEYGAIVPNTQQSNHFTEIATSRNPTHAHVLSA